MSLATAINIYEVARRYLDKLVLPQLTAFQTLNQFDWINVDGQFNQGIQTYGQTRVKFQKAAEVNASFPTSLTADQPDIEARQLQIADVAKAADLTIEKLQQLNSLGALDPDLQMNVDFLKTTCEELFWQGQATGNVTIYGAMDAGSGNGTFLRPVSQAPSNSYTKFGAVGSAHNALAGLVGALMGKGFQHPYTLLYPATAEALIQMPVVAASGWTYPMPVMQLAKLVGFDRVIPVGDDLNTATCMMTGNAETTTDAELVAVADQYIKVAWTEPPNQTTTFNQDTRVTRWTLNARLTPRCDVRYIGGKYYKAVAVVDSCTTAAT